MLKLARYLVPVLALPLAACVITQKEDDEASKVRVVHLTSPEGSVPDAEDLPINNPTLSGNVVTGTADLGEKPLARIENPDGYAPDSPSLFDKGAEQTSAAVNETSADAIRQVVVEEGDTVYSIATAHGLSPRELALANQLDANYTIQPGQVLKLAVGAGAAPNTQDTSGSSTTPAQPPKQRQKETADLVELPSRETNGLRWSWPLKGRITVLKSYQANKANKGMDLQGESSDPVYAAGDGTVVYSGNELKGYGNLIILSHKGDYMSAYAHNSKLLVEADDQVKRGQKIAEVGSVESDKVKLFFQIRHKGEPIDPAPLMPKP